MSWTERSRAGAASSWRRERGGGRAPSSNTIASRRTAGEDTVEVAPGASFSGSGDDARELAEDRGAAFVGRRLRVCGSGLTSGDVLRGFPLATSSCTRWPSRGATPDRRRARWRRRAARRVGGRRARVREHDAGRVVAEDGHRRACNGGALALEDITERQVDQPITACERNWWIMAQMGERYRVLAVVDEGEGVPAGFADGGPPRRAAFPDGV